jgi:hypothetical protein
VIAMRGALLRLAAGLLGRFFRMPKTRAGCVKFSMELSLFVGRRLRLRDFLAGDRFEFAADDVGGKTCAEKAAVHGGEFVFGNFAAEGAECAFEALANDGGLVGFFGGLGEGGFDVAVGDAAGAEVAGDTEFALAANFGALASELFGETLVVDHFGPLETVHDGSKEFVVFGAAAEELLHFMDGVGAAHEGAKGGLVQFCFGFHLSRLREHGPSIEEITASR